jgi:predicted dehydrogenase
MSLLDRRSFLMTPGLFAAREAVGWQGANDRIQLAVVGVRGRGRDHIKGFAAAPGVRVAGVCDIDQSNVERAQAYTETFGGGKPKGYEDLRKLYEDKSIDAVSIANTNHWHALSTIWAVQAGKDVYCEKPVSHNVREGRLMVEAARKYKRIVQAGMQSRSIQHKVKAVERLRAGAIGRVYLAKGLCYKRRKSIGRSPDGPIPAGVNYDIWLGPAPQRTFNPNRFHYNWHWFWDYGNGDIGNQGVHEMDIARWGLHLDSLPKAVSSEGGKFVYDDDQETPNTQTAVFDYGSLQLHFEVRGLLTNGEGFASKENATKIGNAFYGSDGYMWVDSKGYRIYTGEDGALVEEGPFVGDEWNPQGHFDNFIKAVRSRKSGDLACDIEEGHLSAALCHLANISYRLKRRLAFDAAAEKFVNDSEANSMLFRKGRAPYTIPDPV